MAEYTGQMWGGPGHGNLITSPREKFRYTMTESSQVGDSGAFITTNQISGAYVWDAERGLFIWNGPGADGDTIERVRKK